MKRRIARHAQAPRQAVPARSVREVAWSKWIVPKPAVSTAVAPPTGPDGSDDHAERRRPLRRNANSAVERAAAAYRQAQADVQRWATLEVRIRYRTLQRQAANRALDDLECAYLQAMTDELRARGEEKPA
jgi:hypothetical protein